MATAREVPGASEDMQMIYDTSESPLSDDELAVVKQSAEVRCHLWQRRGLYSTGALVLSCALVYPFLEGHSLHSYRESFGKYLLFLPMALLLVFLYCNGLWWGAWQAQRDLKKE
jgi:hypothetical protein